MQASEIKLSSTNSDPSMRITKAKDWLKNDVFPLWQSAGFDPKQNAFVESLSREGSPLPDSRRSLVQARQIYSFAEASRMGLLEKQTAKKMISAATESILKTYSSESGAFLYSADISGKITDKKTDLYTQAFALFGLAHAYDILRDEKLKIRAQKLLTYLQTERRAKAGGYTEFVKGQPVFQSNPHMHLFEGAIAWSAMDSSPQWRALADEIFLLCKTKFIDGKTGALCEQFDENWKPLRESGNFILEPGHHFEWAWLLLEYQRICAKKVGDLPAQLFKIGEAWGVDKKTQFAVDEVWSNGEVKKNTSRCWPQCERIKAAVSLKEAKSADTAMDILFLYFEGIMPGLWEDLHTGEGKFLAQPAKASSLYHIINAISEYAKKRA